MVGRRLLPPSLTPETLLAWLTRVEEDDKAERECYVVTGGDALRVRACMAAEGVSLPGWISTVHAADAVGGVIVTFHRAEAAMETDEAEHTKLHDAVVAYLDALDTHRHDNWLRTHALIALREVVGQVHTVPCSVAR